MKQVTNCHSSYCTIFIKRNIELTFINILDSFLNFAINSPRTQNKNAFSTENGTSNHHGTTNKDDSRSTRKSNDNDHQNKGEVMILIN